MKIDHCVVYLTKKCNLRCSYCFVQDKVEKQQSMKERVAKKTVDFLLGPISKKKLNLSFFGGEPLLEYSLLKNIVHYAKNQSRLRKKKITFSLVTNSTLFDKKKINFLNKHRIRIIISCDGNRESQNKHRMFPNKKGTFDIVNKNIADIVKLKNSCARITFTSSTINKIFDNIKYLYNMGFRDIGCSPVDQKDWSKKEIKIIEKELEKAGKFWFKKYKDGEIFYIKPLTDYFELIENPNQNFRIHMHKCWAGKEGLSIDIDGKIYPCHRFIGIKKFLLGNVFKKRINNNLQKKFQKKPIDAVGCMAINYYFYYNTNISPTGPKKIRDTFLKVANKIYKNL